MLRKLSSKFKRKSTSTQQSGEANKALTATAIVEEVESPATSTPKSRKAVWKEKQQEAAAESLRKRLKAELRPDLSTDGLHQIQLNHVPETQPAESASKCNNASIPQVGKMPSQGIRRVTTKWDSTNPFYPLRSSKTKTEDDIKISGHKELRESQNDNAEKEDHGNMNSDTLKCIALASVPESCRAWRGSVSAAWLQADSHSHPYRHQQSLQKLWKSMSASSPLIVSGLEVNNMLGMSNGSSNESSNGSDASTPVVVARVECELAHPRPSRSSQKKMIKVLVADKIEKDEVVSRQQGHDVSQESESVASYHTARQGSSSG